MLKVKLTGIKMRQREVKQAVDSAARKPVHECALLVEREAKLSMKTGGAMGRIGPRGGYIREPSTPPDPPHVQTGALRASIATADTLKTSVVGPTERYGAVHEFGTRTHPQRPFMRPALRRTQKRFAQKFRNMNLRGSAG